MKNGAAKEEEDGCHKKTKTGQRRKQSKGCQNGENRAAKEDEDGCPKGRKIRPKTRAKEGCPK